MNIFMKHGKKLLALFLICMLVCPTVIQAAAKVNATKITITNAPKNKQMTVGSSYTFKTKITTKSGKKTTDVVKWSLTKNTAKATVSSKGVVKATQEGSFTLTAKTYSGKKVTATSKSVTIKVAMSDSQKLVKDWKSIYSAIKKAYTVKKEGNDAWAERVADWPNIKTTLEEVVELTIKLKKNDELTNSKKEILSVFEETYYTSFINDLAHNVLIGYEENGVQTNLIYLACRDSSNATKAIDAGEALCGMAIDLKKQEDKFINVMKGKMDAFVAAVASDGDVLSCLKEMFIAVSQLKDSDYAWMAEEYSSIPAQIEAASEIAKKTIVDDLIEITRTAEDNPLYQYARSSNPTVVNLRESIELIAWYIPTCISLTGN